MSALKDGCPIFCMDSGAGGVRTHWCVCVCVFKSSRQMCVKDAASAEVIPSDASFSHHFLPFSTPLMAWTCARVHERVLIVL